MKYGTGEMNLEVSKCQVDFRMSKILRPIYE